MIRFSDFRLMMVLLVGAIILGGPAHANEVIRSSTDRLEIEANRGVLIRLDRPATTVFVANPDIADIQVKSPRLIYILGKTPGETTLYAADSQERVIANRTISVSHNLSRLRREIKALLPGANIDIRSIGSRLVLSGTVRSPRVAEEVRRFAAGMVDKPKNVVINLSVISPSQVQLRVRIAEVSRTVLKQFGINWSALFRTGNFLFGIATANPVIVGTALLSSTRATDSLFGGFTTGSLDINGLIDALDDNGLITVLAEPNLTAVSGKPATFLAGGEFPIIVPDNDGRVTIEYKQFGVSLAFTPTILAENRISLHVKPEVSQLSTAGAIEISGFTIPSLTTRRAETTVELGNGQSFAIAGLLQNNVRHDIDKFPGLGDLPVLGMLFRSDRFQRDETELVIIVTPYIVRPVDSDKLAMPTDGMVPPTDEDRILHGRLYRPSGRRDAPAPVVGNRADTRQPIGFVLE